MEKSKKIKLAISRYVFVTLFQLFVVSGIFAQEAAIKGKIVSKDGSAVTGATIIVKGTTRGVVTDLDGNFTITASPTDTLTVNYVGYASQVIPVGGQTMISFTLSEEVKNINEVVVTAFGIAKDTRSIGYSTQKVEGTELTQDRDANAINSLVGKVSGLSVGASSEFFGNPQVVLRGNTDILYVVDGVPINSDTWNISADDIETYTVLKGANAGALYGSRGINGAIVITTKKGAGVKGTSTIEFNTSDMIDPRSFLAVPVRQNEYGIGSNYSYAYGNDPFNKTGGFVRQPVWGPRMEGQGVAQYNSPLGANGIRTQTPFNVLGANNFYNFMEGGYHTTNNLSITASGEKYDLRISMSDVYQKGIDPNTELNSSNGNIYAGYNFTKKLRIEGNLNYNYQYSPNVPDAIYGPQSYTYMIQEYGSANFDVRSFKNYWQAPGTPGIQQAWVEYGRANNPYFMANQWLRSHTKADIYGYGKLDYAITPELHISFRAQASGYSMMRTEILPTSAITYSLSSGGIQEGTVNGASTGEYREDRRMLYDNNNDVMLSYNKNVTPDFFVSALVGGNVRTFTYNSSWTSTNNIVVPGVYNFTNTLNPLVSYNFNSGMNVLSAYYSVDASYKKYVSANTTGRLDNSSVFYPGQQNYFYPSVSLSSVVTDYVKIPVVSFLKIRGSYANVKGGLTTPTAGPSFDLLGQPTPLGYGSSYYSSYDGPSYTNQNAYSINHLYNNTPSANYANTMANPTLKPFTVSSMEFGGDIKLLNNRIGLGATYYTTTNGPTIFPQQVAASTGYYSQNVNGITTTKNGWELDLAVTPFKNPNGFSWELTANWSTFVEKLKSIYEADQSVLLNGHYYQVGDRLDAIYGYKFYRDLQGQVINAAGSPLVRTTGANYEQKLGYANPDYVWGITNKFSYKDLSVSFQFDGRVGGVIFDEIYADMLQSGNATDLVNGAMGAARLAEWNEVKANNYVAPSNLQGQYVAPGVEITSGTPIFDSHGNITNMNTLQFSPNETKVRLQTGYISNINGVFQEPYMVSKTYFMMRDLKITYNLPKKFLARTAFKRASVSLVGRNLLYITALKRKDVDLDQYPVGFDVSRIGQTKNQTDQSNGYGTENLNLITSASMQTPIVRQFGFNINVAF